jgi:hypothetical protein
MKATDISKMYSTILFLIFVKAERGERERYGRMKE